MTRLRLVFLALALAATPTLTGCKDADKAGEAEAASAAATTDDSSAKAAEDLLARRDALMSSREKIRAQMAELEQERARIVESGGDPSEVDRKAAELRTESEKIASQETALTDQMEAFLQQARSLARGGDVQERVAARESAMASREKAVASREDRIAEREARLAERERALAVRERDTCGVAAAPTTIIQTVDPKGAKYSKRDVEPLLKKARDQMSRKGILASDLPPQAQGLEREATKAMADGDYGPARFAAQQLLATVDAQRIDRAFISAKIARLSKAMSGRKLEDKQQKEVDELFRDATAKYGDGDYSGANKKLNAIWRAVD